MCGILGSFNLQSNSENIQGVELAMDRLKHRGPDDNGIETFNLINGTLTLGHTRLAIIDTSSGGHQPFRSQNNRYTLVYNGEIYNYRELKEELKEIGCVFKTDSDTEVLMALWENWGINGVHRLTGMFAFAIFDSKNQTLTILRDAFGIKPIFYYSDEQSLYFSSEIPALLKMLPYNIKPDPQRAYNYLIWGQYDYCKNTFFEGVNRLLPGQYIEIDLNKIKRSWTLDAPKTWWSPSIKERSDLSFEEASLQLRDLFLKSVKLHLRSDVPIGAALSGGIDSSAVVCAMRYLEPDIPIHTFSFIAKGSNLYEEYWIDIVNEYVGAIPKKIYVEPHELANDLDDMILNQGEPFGGTSIYAQYRVFKEAKNSGIIVTLDGQGADELLAGYNGYPEGLMHSLLESSKYLKTLKFLNKWSMWPERSILLGCRMLINLLIHKKYWLFFQKFRKKFRKDPYWIDTTWLKANNINLFTPEISNLNKEGFGRRLMEKLRNVLTKDGLEPLLRHGDRNSMRWSIESRVPFLTTEIAEFLLSLPEHYLLSYEGETKSVFRSAMRGIVPDLILDRKDKIGFQTQEINWLKKYGERINSWSGIKNSDIPFINIDKLKQEVTKILSDGKPCSPEVWRLINYCRWVQLNYSSNV